MSRSRNLLHVSRLTEFQRFCEGRGWVAEPNKGDWDALRMRHPKSSEALVVYRRAVMPEHFTVFGVGLRLALEFVKSPRPADRETVSHE